MIIPQTRTGNIKNITFTDDPYFLEEDVQRIVDIKSVTTTVYRDNPTDVGHIVDRAKGADLIVVDVMTEYSEEVLEQLPNLKYIIAASVGFDYVDIEYCKRSGIGFQNLPGFPSIAVAEQAFANLISLMRKVPQGVQNVIGGGWDSDQFGGVELHGKTLGIIGSGGIGSEISKIGRGFGMDILCHTRNPSAEKAASLGLELFHSFEHVLQNSDFIIIAVPLDDSTRDMFGRAEFDMMKETAYIVNPARQFIITPLALAEAIYEKKIAGAALDFIDTEPFNIFKADLRIQEMIASPNVVLTPHTAWNTTEALQRKGNQLYEVVENLI